MKKKEADLLESGGKY